MTQSLRCDLTVYRGETLAEVIFALLQTLHGPAVNITGASAELLIRRADGTLLDTLSTSNGGLTLTPLAGIIQPVRTAAQTTAYDLGEHAFTLTVTLSASDVRTTHFGSFTVRDR